MSNRIKGVSSKKSNEITGKSNSDSAERKADSNIVFNLKYFDINQGQSFEEWEEKGILAHGITFLLHFSRAKQKDYSTEKYWTSYKQFPEHSNFKIPKYLVEYNIETWGRIRTEGKTRICGFMVENVFYVVFLDKNHEFFPSEKH